MLKEKIFTCDVCGKEVSLSGKKDIVEICYRTISLDNIWSSKWRTLCDDCRKDFQKLISKEHERNV